MIGVGMVDLDGISPIRYVDRIQRPLLLGQGANDPRVKVAESKTIAAAMEERQLPIDLVVFPDKGHGLSNPCNSLVIYALLEAFSGSMWVVGWNPSAQHLNSHLLSGDCVSCHRFDNGFGYSTFGTYFIFVSLPHLRDVESWLVLLNRRASTEQSCRAPMTSSF